jgi:Protein of unknown function (DUF3093)
VSPVVRFAPSRKFLLLGCVALAGAAASGAVALRLPLAWIPVALFLVSSLPLFLLALRPAIEIYESHLQVGRRAIPWSDIRRVDQTNWKAPLVVDLTISPEGLLRLVYPGDMEACGTLLGCLRRYSREALLDGVTYAQYWGEPATLDRRGLDPRHLPPPRYPLLRPDDEEEVERMFQRLKTVGHLDQQGVDRTEP